MEWSSIGGSKNELVADGLLGSAGGEERSGKARGYSGLGHPGRAGGGINPKNIKLSFLILICSGGKGVFMRGEKKEWEWWLAGKSALMRVCMYH